VTEFLSVICWLMKSWINIISVCLKSTCSKTCLICLMSVRHCGIWRSEMVTSDIVGWTRLRSVSFPRASLSRGRCQLLHHHTQTRLPLLLPAPCRKIQNAAFACRSSSATTPFAHCPAFTDSTANVLITGLRSVPFPLSFSDSMCLSFY